MAKKASDVISAGVANNISEKKNELQSEIRSNVKAKWGEAQWSEAKPANQKRGFVEESTIDEVWIMDHEPNSADNEGRCDAAGR